MKTSIAAVAFGTVVVPLRLLLLSSTAVEPIDALFLTSIWQRLTGNTAAANNHNDDDAVRPAELIVRQDDVGRLEDNGVQGNIIAGDFLRDIARQPGSTAMLRDDDVIRQPAAALQNGILRQPVELQDNTVDLLDTVTDQRMQLFVDETTLDFTYWNSELGNNKPIAIELNNEKNMIGHWLAGKPLKVITHGWKGSDDGDRGVFTIKTAYVAVGGYNVITADWSRVAGNVAYPLPAYMTVPVGAVIAKLLENFVDLAVIDPSDIHLIGHSLGAHVSGACGAAFRPGKIGRVTGLDPAGPGFEYVALRSDRLDSTDAQFVDAIHTAVGTLGYGAPIGSADFYPNGGTPPQPGCFESYSPSSFVNAMGCSHSRSHVLYTESVYNRRSFVSTKCGSWEEYAGGTCRNNEKTHMGHDADPKMSGVFYLKTNSASPYSIPDAIES